MHSWIRCVHETLSYHKAIDPQGKLGTYARVNPTMETPQCYSTALPMFEPDRILLSRFRTGSHNLRIESGRWSRLPREERMCRCGPHIQTLDHVVYSCNLLAEHRQHNHRDLEDFFKQPDAISFLHKVNATFKL